MAAFTAKDVSALRERTGCGMMDCKKALTASEGDMEKAIEFLREKGLAAAAKKAGRIAAEGVVYAMVDEEKKVGVVIEVNSETDFVAKNEKFMDFVAVCAKTIVAENPADVEALLNCNAVEGEGTIAAQLQDKILTIGENMKIRRFVRYEGNAAAYVHGGGRIGVLVRFDTNAANNDAFKDFAKTIAMQIVASNPAYVDKDSVPADVVAHEKEILTAQAVNEGKPVQIAEKMVMGRIGKFYKEVCLVEQPFIKDADTPVGAFISQSEKDLGASIKICEFVRFEKGEGLEKREDNFADEVASMVK
jgi:elongation factor Ts